MNKRKEIHIIGGGLYGCLLAYRLINKKYKVHIFEKSNQLVNSFDSIKLDNILLNNGFHGIDLPRSKNIFNFFKKKLRVEFNIFDIKRKIIFENSLIDYTAKTSDWPRKIRNLIKKNSKSYKDQNFNHFFKKELMSLYRKCSSKYFDKPNQGKSFFLPWFLPADIKHISSDEGDKFRSLIRQKKIKGNIALPKRHLFSSIKKKMLNFLVSKGVSVHFGTEIKIINNEIKYFLKKKEIFFEKKNIRRIFYCLSSAFLIKDVNLKHFKKIDNFKKFSINCIVKIKDKNFDSNFSEILCFNKKIHFSNRIYPLSFYGYQKKKTTNFLVIEIISKKNFLSLENKRILTQELQKIFNLKIRPSISDYKVTRQMYFLEKKWIDKSKRILNKRIKKSLNLSYMNNYQPLNMNKAWINALKNSNLR